MANFTVVEPDIYKNLAKRWWNWVYVHDCDNVSFPDVTFLRGDIIGGERKISQKMLSTPLTQLDYYFRKEIHIKPDTNLFFTVYGSHFVIGDPYNGRKCKNTDECLEAARKDFGELKEKWATIQVSDGQVENIVSNLDSHYIETNVFVLHVPDENELKREKDFYLGKGDYKGVYVGICMYMTDLKAGRYEIDFGGKATNYFTRAVYTVNVK